MIKINFKALSEVLVKLPKLFLGFALASLGVTLMLTAGIGMNPWGTFTSGLVNLTGISFGRLSQLIGLTILIGTIPMKNRPGIGTIFNMIFIGFFIDLFKSSGLIIQPNHFILQILMCITGLIIFSIGIYVYISCGLGAGPRDGLMLALIKITGKSVTVVRTSLEITVVIIGILLGGPIGIGTVIVALLGGRILDIIFTRMQFDPKKVEHQSLVDFSKKLFST